MRVRQLLEIKLLYRIKLTALQTKMIFLSKYYLIINIFCKLKKPKL